MEVLDAKRTIDVRIEDRDGETWVAMRDEGALVEMPAWQWMLELSGRMAGTSKLTLRQVAAIRRMKGHFTADQLAARFGVSRRTIFRVLARDTHFHVKPDGDEVAPC